MDWSGSWSRTPAANAISRAYSCGETSLEIEENLPVPGVTFELAIVRMESNEAAASRLNGIFINLEHCFHINLRAPSHPVSGVRQTIAWWILSVK
jgi:hypothetical protein